MPAEPLVLPIAPDGCEYSYHTDTWLPGWYVRGPGMRGPGLNGYYHVGQLVQMKRDMRRQL